MGGNSSLLVVELDLIHEGTVARELLSHEHFVAVLLFFYLPAQKIFFYEVDFAGLGTQDKIVVLLVYAGHYWKFMLVFLFISRILILTA